MKHPIKHPIIIILLSLIILSCTNKKQINQSRQQDIELDIILKDWGDSFCHKIDSSYKAVINFIETDKDIAYHIIIKNNHYTLCENMNDSANFTFKSSLRHYNKIHRQEMTGFTSVGRANMSDKTPLDVDIYRPITNNLMNDLLFFIRRFFNSSPYDKVILGEEYSRMVHGAHAIPLFYQTSNDIGVRSAWYQINKGEKINEPGDTNPFPQYFIIINGKGFAKIGLDTIPIKKNESYYIAPGQDHIFWNESEEPIELIFLAFGKGA